VQQPELIMHRERMRSPLCALALFCFYCEAFITVYLQMNRYWLLYYDSPPPPPRTLYMTPDMHQLSFFIWIHRSSGDAWTVQVNPRPLLQTKPVMPKFVSSPSNNSLRSPPRRTETILTDVFQLHITSRISTQVVTFLTFYSAYDISWLSPVPPGKYRGSDFKSRPLPSTSFLIH
jgi:hypothetical protein